MPWHPTCHSFLWLQMLPSNSISHTPNFQHAKHAWLHNHDSSSHFQICPLSWDPIRNWRFANIAEWICQNWISQQHRISLYWWLWCNQTKISFLIRHVLNVTDFEKTNKPQSIGNRKSDQDLCKISTLPFQNLCTPDFQSTMWTTTKDFCG